MKTPNLHLIGAMIPLAVLLLSQCAPTGGTQPEAARTRASSAPHRVQVVSRPMTIDPLGISFNDERSEPSESELSDLMPLDLPVTAPDDSDAVQMAPIVVTGSPVSDPVTDDWPASAIDAELKSSWISPKQSVLPRRHPTEDSVSEWMQSLRR